MFKFVQSREVESLLVQSFSFAPSTTDLYKTNDSFKLDARFEAFLKATHPYSSAQGRLSTMWVSRCRFWATWKSIHLDVVVFNGV